MSDMYKGDKKISQAEYDARYKGKSNVVQIDHDFQPGDCTEAFCKALNAIGVKTTYILIDDVPSLFVEISIPGRRSG